MAKYSLLLERAYRLAATAHAGQKRKVSDLPYIIHPCAVANILAKEGFDDDILITALLHDVIEDTDVVLDDIREEFPKQIVEWVDFVSEEKEDAEGEEVKWGLRKEAHIEKLKNAPMEARAVVLADKLHNLSAILYDLKNGENVWDRFHGKKDRTLNYYENMLAAVFQGEERLKPLADACRAVLDELNS